MKFILSLLGIMLMILRLSFQHEIELEPNEDEIEQKVTNEIVDSIDFEEYETTKTVNIDDSKIENYSDQQAQEGEIDKNKLNQVENQDKKNVVKEVTIQVSPKGMIEKTRTVDSEGNEKIEVRILDSEDSIEEKQEFNMISDEVSRELNMNKSTTNLADKSSNLYSDTVDNDEEFGCNEEKTENLSRPSADNENAKEYANRRFHDGPKVTVKDIPGINDDEENIKLESSSNSFLNVILISFILVSITLIFLRVTGLGKTFFEDIESLSWMKVIYSSEHFNNKSL